MPRMIHKRFFLDEELYRLSAKHPRLMEHTNSLVPCLEFLPSESSLQQPFTLGDSGGFTNEGVEKLAYEAISKHSANESDTTLPGCLFISSWTTNTSFQDPNSNHLMKNTTTLHSEDIYSLLLAHSPRKSVPIGTDHQANVPPWASHVGSNTPDPEDSDRKLMGMCILPMPESNSSCDPENGNSPCKCDDNGSTRCIKKHVSEAREGLRRNLGQERFTELGLSFLGEEVAANWNPDEEKVFQEVVFSNPPSSGNNFWDNLSAVFPAREKKEMVSYYFNVFILRKRSEQNRSDPANIDSDDDEWRDYYNEDYYSPLSEDDRSLGFEDVESCTSFDLGGAKPREGDPWGHGARCFHNVGGHEFVLGACDSRDWESEHHLSCLGNEVEFLPTCSMIKEVFGDAQSSKRDEFL